jgi:hypothetical protein
MADDPLRGIPPELIAQLERYGVEAVAADLENEHRGGRKLVEGPPGTGVQAYGLNLNAHRRKQRLSGGRESERAEFAKRRRERAERKREQKQASAKLRQELERAKIQRRQWEQSEAARREWRRADNREIFTAKPGLWGFNIDLKAAAKAIWPRIKGKWPFN